MLTQEDMKKRYRQLSEEERDIIAIKLLQGVNKSKRAEDLNRDRATIYRELKRNSIEGRVYLAIYANGLSKDRLSKSRICGRIRNKQIKDYIEHKLRIKWSPELISGRLSKEHHELSISHETIYQWIYNDAREHISNLVRSHKKRQLVKSIE